MTTQIALGAPTFGEEEVEAVREVLQSGWVAGQGPRCRELETRFAASVDSTHAVAMNNCTAALHVAMLGLGVSAGDEVIVADYTFPATGHSVLYAGGTPVFADVCADTWCVDPADVESLVSERTVGIVAVDVAGQCGDLDQLRALARQHSLFLVEDAACSAGATFRGLPAGHPDLADVATFSLHGRKGITSGEGGVLVTSDDRLADFARQMITFGIESALQRQEAAELPIPSFTTLGYNYKLSDIAAAIATVQLGRLAELVGRRRRIAAMYEDLFADSELIDTPKVASGREHAWQSYILTLDHDVDRGRTAMALRDRGIGANIGTYASHLQPVYGATRPCPVSADVFRRHLAIPMHANLSESDVERVAAEVKACVIEHSRARTA